MLRIQVDCLSASLNTNMSQGYQKTNPPPPNYSSAPVKHPHSPTVVGLLVQQVGLLQQQGGDLLQASFQSWGRSLLHLVPEKPSPCLLQQHHQNSLAQNCSQVGWGAGNGIYIQRHEGGKCSTPINTCGLHLRSGRRRTRPSSSLDPTNRR